jgi:hypothetical protein
MGRPLRALLLGCLGGGVAAAIVYGVAALCVWAAMTTGLTGPIAGPRPRIPQLIVACALAGALPGVLAPRIRKPGMAALLGAATAIAATSIHRLLDAGAYDPLSATLAPALAQLLMPGLLGLAAPVLWAPVRAAAARGVARAAVEIGGRVGALVLGFLFALLAAPTFYFGALALFAGLARLEGDAFLLGLRIMTVALALVGAGTVCHWFAGVPRGSGPLPGFEPRGRSNSGSPS